MKIEEIIFGKKGSLKKKDLQIKDLGLDGFEKI